MIRGATGRPISGTLPGQPPNTDALLASRPSTLGSTSGPSHINTTRTHTSSSASPSHICPSALSVPFASCLPLSSSACSPSLLSLRDSSTEPIFDPVRPSASTRTARRSHHDAPSASARSSQHVAQRSGKHHRTSFCTRLFHVGRTRC